MQALPVASSIALPAWMRERHPEFAESVDAVNGTIADIIDALSRISSTPSSSNAVVAATTTPSTGATTLTQCACTPEIEKINEAIVALTTRVNSLAEQMGSINSMVASNTASIASLTTLVGGIAARLQAIEESEEYIDLLYWGDSYLTWNGAVLKWQTNS